MSQDHNGGNAIPEITREEHDGRVNAKRTVDVNLAMIIDEADASTIYIGKAAIGIATSASFWQIKKFITSGTVTTTTWADGDDNYDNVWDSRTSLIYA